jgi:hypothetical protein
MKRSLLLSTIAAATLAAFQAQAASDRVFVSTRIGADAAGCGAVTTPCRTFQFAHDEVAAGGQVQVLDPGDYGPVNIAKAISIVNDGVGAAGVLDLPANNTAIYVGAGPADIVTLRGLTIVGSSSGQGGGNGVSLISGRSANISGMRLRKLQMGIIVDTMNFSIFDSTVTDTDSAIVVDPTTGGATGVIQRVTASHNTSWGLQVDANYAKGPTKVEVSDSVFTQNCNGVLVNSSGRYVADVTLRGVVSSANNACGPGVGYTAIGPRALIRLAHSVATDNGVGVTIGAGPAVVESYRDNDLRGNTVAVSGGALTVVPNQ